MKIRTRRAPEKLVAQRCKRGEAVDRLVGVDLHVQIIFPGAQALILIRGAQLELAGRVTARLNFREALKIAYDLRISLLTDVSVASQQSILAAFPCACNTRHPSRVRSAGTRSPDRSLPVH